ncbi:MAG: HAMP domain-containing protein, partial [Acidimicrobiales bacterium]
MVVPITAVGAAVLNLIGRELDQRTLERLQQNAAFAESALAARGSDIVRAAVARTNASFAALIAEGGPSLDAALRNMLDLDDLDIAVVAGPAGDLLAAARRRPEFRPEVDPPPVEAMVGLAARPDAILARAEVAVPGAPGPAVLVAGIWLDTFRLARLYRAADVHYTIVAGDRVVASTGNLTSVPDGPDDTQFTTAVRGQATVVYPIGIRGTTARLLVTTRPPLEGRQTELAIILALVVAVVVVLIVLVGYVVSGLVTGPVQDLAAAALAVARGDLDRRVEVQGGRELAALGRAFNQMTDDLRAHVHELGQSRTELRQAVARLGDVLTSTHDLEGIIEVVLEASTLTLRAESSVFFERLALPARIRASTAHGVT